MTRHEPEKHSVIRWILLPVFAALCAAVVELVCLLPLLKLPADRRQDVSLVLTDGTVASAEAASGHDDSSVKSEDGWEEEWEEERGDAGEDAGLTLTAAQSLTFSWNGYLNELTLTGLSDQGQDILLTVRLEDGSEAALTSGFVPALGEDTIHVGRNVISVTIRPTYCDLTLSGVTVQNGIRINGNRVLLVALLAACVWMLAMFSSFFCKKPEFAFLMIALAIGLYTSIGTPAALGLCWDDHIHFNRVQLLSHGLDSSSTSFTDNLYELSFNQRHTAPGASDKIAYVPDTVRDQEAYAAMLDREYASDTAWNALKITHKMSDTGYLLQACGMAAARAIGLPFSRQLIWARLFNMLGYVLFTFLGIRCTQRFKLTMSCVALSPLALFLAGSFSYDPTINGLCFFGICLVTDAILDRRAPLTWQRGLGILLALTLGGVVKTVYTPLLLLVLLLPRSKFASDSQRILFKTGAVLICAAAIGSMVLNVTGDMDALYDSRAENADAAAQIQFVLHNPLTYAGYLIRYLFQTAPENLSTVGQLCPSAAESLRLAMFWPVLILLILTALTDEDEGRDLELLPLHRISFAVITLIVSTLICSFLYASFNAVGSNQFKGVQARYFLPVLPLVYFLLCPRTRYLKVDRKIKVPLCFFLNLAILAVFCFLQFQIPYRP